MLLRPDETEIRENQEIERGKGMEVYQQLSIINDFPSHSDETHELPLCKVIRPLITRLSSVPLMCPHHLCVRCVVNGDPDLLQQGMKLIFYDCTIDEVLYVTTGATSCFLSSL